MIEKGVLVSFCPVETSVDLVHPIGLCDRNLLSRLFPEMSYRPAQGETGLIIGGPSLDKHGGTTLWLVYVGSAGWWFPEDHLVPREP